MIATTTLFLDESFGETQLWLSLGVLVIIEDIVDTLIISKRLILVMMVIFLVVILEIGHVIKIRLPFKVLYSCFNVLIIIEW